MNDEELEKRKKELYDEKVEEEKNLPKGYKFSKKHGSFKRYGEDIIANVSIVRDGAKVGRNELCPCNSNKKYKNCCGR